MQYLIGNIFQQKHLETSKLYKILQKSKQKAVFTPFCSIKELNLPNSSQFFQIHTPRLFSTLQKPTFSSKAKSVSRSQARQRASSLPENTPTLSTKSNYITTQPRYLDSVQSSPMTKRKNISLREDGQQMHQNAHRKILISARKWVRQNSKQNVKVLNNSTSTQLLSKQQQAKSFRKQHQRNKSEQILSQRLKDNEQQLLMQQQKKHVQILNNFNASSIVTSPKGRHSRKNYSGMQNKSHQIINLRHTFNIEQEEDWRKKDSFYNKGRNIHQRFNKTTLSKLILQQRDEQIRKNQKKQSSDLKSSKLSKTHISSKSSKQIQKFLPPKSSKRKILKDALIFSEGITSAYSTVTSPNNAMIMMKLDSHQNKKKQRKLKKNQRILAKSQSGSGIQSPQFTSNIETQMGITY